MATSGETFLTNYYLNEFVPSLPSSLQSLALDRGIWISSGQSGLVTSAIEFDRGHYSLLPWHLQTIFQLSIEETQTIGKAWFLMLGYYVILDHIIDGKLPAIPVTSLFLASLQFEAQLQFRTLLGQSARFWNYYDINSRECVFAMIQENNYVINHEAPYSYSAMYHIHQKKSGIVRLLVHAMAELGNKLQYEEALCRIFENHALATQLLDDTLDWEIDFEQDHYKVPLAMALEAAQLPFENLAQHMTVESFGQCLVKYNIPVQICQLAVNILEEALNSAKEINDGTNSLSKMLQENVQIASNAQKRWKAWCSILQFVPKFDI